jgi:arsenate reductase
VGWTLLLNRRSTTWRALGETQRQVRDAEDACRLIHEYPALLKRPVLDRDGELLVGFKAGEYARFLG